MNGEGKMGSGQSSSEGKRITALGQLAVWARHLPSTLISNSEIFYFLGYRIRRNLYLYFYLLKFALGG